MDASQYLPKRHDLDSLRRAADGCRGCPLWSDATQTVFGEGGREAELMLVGEQPGDREDREGEPFVGPAGGVLDRALEEAGIDRDAVYVTNAVKHFKWRPSGPRRIHQTPRVGEVAACRPWLEAEADAVGPKAVLAMGTTAARSVFGPGVKVLRDRGEVLETPLAPLGAVTIHPSAVLRAREQRREAMETLVEDLSAMAARL